MIVVGADENGLGPLLGPLVTTSVAIAVPTYDRARLLRKGHKVGIDDSKSTAGFGKMAVAESLALAVAEQQNGWVPGHADALLEALSLHPPQQLRKRCPPRARAQCWAERVPLPCFGGDVGRGREMLFRLTKQRITIERVRSALACTSYLNEQLAEGVSRVALDLHLMEELLIDARAHVGQPLLAVCGMVGGIRDYPKHLRHLRAEPLARTKRVIAYRSPTVGEVRFEIDADARHLPVALSSMVGKYVRELWMERQNRFYQSLDPALASVSGYHDPVTRRFIGASAALRTRLGVPDGCFRRDNAADAKGRAQLPLFDSP